MGCGVSFSRSESIARQHGRGFKPYPLIVADASQLRLYPLSAEEQLYRKRQNGKALSTLHKEGWDGIDFCDSEGAIRLWDSIRHKFGAPGLAHDEQEVCGYSPPDCRSFKALREVKLAGPCSDLGSRQQRRYPPVSSHIWSSKRWVQFSDRALELST